MQPSGNSTLKSRDSRGLTDRRNVRLDAIRCSTSAGAERAGPLGQGSQGAPPERHQRSKEMVMRGRFALALVAAGSLVLAACGGGTEADGAADNGGDAADESYVITWINPL